MSGNSSKQDVREFYDEIGWKKESDGYYQNARYEDLRPVSAEYIHNCHMRITPYFQNGGKYFLDAGSGPVQYPEYLTYSEKFEKRVCADISITALIEARKRLGDKGLYVVSDVSALPFKENAFDGVVSLHTLHHLNLDDQKKAWQEIYRTLNSGCTAVVVNGWTESKMMKKWLPAVRKAEKLGHFLAVICGKEKQSKKTNQSSAKTEPTGTYIQKLDADWIRGVLPSLGKDVEYKILCWRSVNVRWLRALIHRPYGKKALCSLFKKETQRPEYYGEYGQYPLIVLTRKKNMDQGS